MNEISRRTVAKGALWAAPAVVVASGSPAFAASPPTFILDFVMDTPDNFPGIVSALPDRSTDSYSGTNGTGPFVRLGIRNAGTGTLPAGQQFSVTFNVTGDGTTWRYDWNRPGTPVYGPNAVYWRDVDWAIYTAPGAQTRTFTLNRALEPGQAISMAPAIINVVGVEGVPAAASMVATVLPTTDVSVQGNRTFTINNILLPRASWVIEAPIPALP